MPVFIADDGTKLYYDVKGHGSAIVFTHGLAMNSEQWRPQIKALSPYYRTVVWDVRGHGRSGLPPGEINPESFNHDLKQLLTHLQLGPAILCGLSMGGHISLQTAVRYPEAVEGLVLLGTPYTNKFNWFEWLAAPASKLLLRLLPYRLTAQLAANVLSSVNPANRRVVLDALGYIAKDTLLRNWSGYLKLESREDLPKIGCPTLILHGDRDSLVRHQQPFLRSQIREAEFRTVPNAHHLTNMDNPECVNRHLLSFMGRISGKLPDK